MRKEILGIHGAPEPHWVGDGFHVQSLLPVPGATADTSRFLLLDYAAPEQMPPSDLPRGVGEHPHRGFETVTLLYQGELEHRDSAGNHGRLEPGDVQWMTAAAGVVHEEKFAADFARRGGVVEMVQLWVNLPRARKMDAPGYQALDRSRIPVVALDDGAGQVRVVAGEFGSRRGPARTATPVELFEVTLEAGAELAVPIADGHNAVVVILSGTGTVNGSAAVIGPGVVVLHPAGDEVVLKAGEATTLLVLAGAPIDEPVVSHGPFVMNTSEEIHQAVVDYRAGKMGRLD